MALLLDTHALYWLGMDQEQMTARALAAVQDERERGILYVSAVSAWELGAASQKPEGRGRPDLGGKSAADWFRTTTERLGARVVPIGRRIALEAAEVPLVYSRKDPGDCFLIATARVRRCPIVTRDGAMLGLACERPDYLAVVPC